VIARILIFAIASAQAVTEDSATTAGVLQSAHIRIVLEGSDALVLSTYRIDRSGEPLQFNAVRMPGQTTVVEGAFGPGFELTEEDLANASELTAPAGPPGLVYVRIRYRVEGDFSRLPVFVPNAETKPGVSLIRLLIVGAPESLVIDDTYPRFEWQQGGLLVSAPPELPRAVSLPSARKGLPHTRIALLTGILLLLAAAVYWATRRVGARRRPTRSSGPATPVP
jgi:hypothetical protein